MEVPTLKRYFEWPRRAQIVLLAILAATCLLGRAYLFAGKIQDCSFERCVPTTPDLTTPAGVGYGYDPHDYLFLAHRLSSGNGYTYEDGAPTAYRPPLYPLFLAVIRPGFPAASTSPLWWNFALSSLAILLIGLVAARESGRLAFAAIIPILSFNVLWIEADTHIWSESLYTFLLSASVLLWTWGDGCAKKSRNTMLLAGAGIVLGLAVLIRPLTIIASVFAVGYLVLIPPRKSLATAIGFLVLSAALPASWVVRNHLVAGMPGTLSTNGGMNLYIGNNPEGINWASELSESKAYREIMAGRKTISELEADKGFHRRAVGYIEADTSAFLSRSLAKSREFIAFLPHGSIYARIMTLLILIPLMAVGVFGAIRRRRSGLVLAFVLLVVPMLVYSVYWVWWRLAISYMPLAWLLCFSGISLVARRTVSTGGLLLTRYRLSTTSRQCCS